ncbi:MAG: hypothetical protein LBH80_06720 [Prevotellaceae bacterium]|jgi:7-keto-8-aminopelargonate synthetase-like enzyme|nr:hypothetical protein [Prevotellaceae bacterium]
MTGQLLKLSHIAGGLFTLSGIVLQLLNNASAPYLFAAGALLLVFVQAKHSLQSRQDNKRLQRLRRLQFLTSLLLIVAAYLMFVKVDLWIIAVLIYGPTSVFLALRDKTNH